MKNSFYILKLKLLLNRLAFFFEYGIDPFHSKEKVNEQSSLFCVQSFLSQLYFRIVTFHFTSIEICFSLHWPDFLSLLATVPIFGILDHPNSRFSVVTRRSRKFLWPGEKRIRASPLPPLNSSIVSSFLKKFKS